MGKMMMKKRVFWGEIIEIFHNIDITIKHCG